MKLFRRGKRIEAPVTAAAQGTASGLFPAVNSYTPLVLCQNTLYKSLMEAGSHNKCGCSQDNPIDGRLLGGDRKRRLR